MVVDRLIGILAVLLREERVTAGQLAVLAAVLTQLGDTLETLAVQAAFLEKEDR